MQLKNKIALITGGASGIGRGIALAFASAGAKVIVTDINLSEANKVVEEISSHQGIAFAKKMDVTDEQEVNEVIDNIASQLGGIDILVSNAGIQCISSIDKLSFADWKKMLAIHLDGAFLTSRACLKHMYAQNRGGSIIFIGSVHSHEASPLKAPYVTAKHGLLGLCRVLAKEAASYGVRANVICPGFVLTPLVQQQIPELSKEFNISEEEVIQKILLKNTINGKFTTIEDIAEAALFFSQFNSNALTGQSMIVSNGWYMQ